ncbi:hypothetical protein GCM10011383_04930 [Hymenobacter cavernae]|uniref:Secretion system C-terminal sorting domain-containing protein n=2 Tax=Hymenobacter cavernae TaxID=2044852 RepID=A0ABQ1TNC3_9BACT|nr:hypothetical protein GCM10011383_04930 [Hymenobacter cavernae]
MSGTAATDAAIKVFGSQTGKRAGTFSGAGTNTITFDPSQDLKPGETASVSVTTAARSASNLGLAKASVHQFTGAVSAGSGTFSAATSVPTGSGAYGVAAADIDGDGDADMLVANYSAGNVSVRLNDGSGNFSGTTTLTTGGGANKPVAADIDGDGDVDLLVGNTTAGTVSVRFNDGRGNFSGTTNLTIGAPYELAVADIDGDGDLDLLSTSYNAGAILVRLNDGSGNFSGSGSVAIGDGAGSVVAADVDADGDIDLFAGAVNGLTAVVRINDGQGNFSGGSTIATNVRPYAMTSADVDGDGDMDLLIGDFLSRTVLVRLNNGTGSFSGTTSVGINGQPSAIQTADIDADGDLDFLTANSNNTVSVALNDGSGNFSLKPSLSAGSSPQGVTLADVNNDGAIDVLVANYSSNNVSVLLNKVVSPPTITSFTPTSGTAGTSVVLTGTNFTGATSVKFNGTAAASYTVNSATQLTAIVPAGATTGTISVVTPGGTVTSTQSFNVVADLVVANSQYVSGSYRNVTVTGSGTAILQGNLTVTGTLTVQNGGNLNIKGNTVTGNSFVLAAGGTLTIGGIEGIAASGNSGGIQTTDRSFSSDANYVYGSYQPGAVTGSGLPAQVRSLSVIDIYGDNETYLQLSNDLAIAQTLNLDYDLNTNGRNLTLLSNAAGTALVVNNGGVVNGAVTVQRYVDGSLNPTAGYRHLTAPVSNTTVADLATPGFTPTVNAVYNNSATPGMTTPYPTIFGYDEQRLATSPATGLGAFDKGWFSPADFSSALQVGKAYTVNLAANQTLDFVGTLNDGRVDLPLTRGTDSEGGWNLIGNPYPSPLDWSQVTAQPGVDAAMYVYQSTSQYGGQYRSYVNGIGNPLVALGQGFFVRTSPGSSTATLTLNNKSRVTSFELQPALQRTTTSRPLAHLTLSRSGNTFTDETYVYFQKDATAGTDARYDALKIQHNSGGAPSLYSLAAAQELSINGLPELSTSTEVPLGIDLPQAGTYTLEANELLNLSTASVYLLDKVTGEQVNLAQQPRYTFSVAAATQTNTRFVLRFATTAVLASKAGLTAPGVSLYPNPAHQSVTLLVPAEAGTQEFSAELYNNLGQAVRRQSAALPTSGAQLSFDVAGLAPGVYTMRLHLGQRIVNKRLVIK